MLGINIASGNNIVNVRTALSKAFTLSISSSVKGKTGKLKISYQTSNHSTRGEKKIQISQLRTSMSADGSMIFNSIFIDHTEKPRGTNYMMLRERNLMIELK